MSFETRFEIPSIVDDAIDMDLTICETCPHKDCGCRDGKDCVMEADQ